MPTIRARANTSEINRITTELYRKMNLIHVTHNARLMAKHKADIGALVVAKSKDFQEFWKYLTDQGYKFDQYLDPEGVMYPTQVDVNYMLEDVVRVVVQTYYNEKDIEGSMKTIKEKLLEMYKL